MCCVYGMSDMSDISEMSDMSDMSEDSMTCLDKPTAPRRHLGMSDMSDMSYDMTCRICRNMS